MRAPCSDSEPFSFGVWIGTRATAPRAWARSLMKTPGAALDGVRPASAEASRAFCCSAATICAWRRLSACGRITMK
ncbi:hypothetical protein D3C73_966760 [compost metagenome]